MHKFKKKYKIIFFLLFLFFFCFIVFHAHNYQVTYIKNGISITEEYHKKQKRYSFTFTVDGEDFFTSLEGKYSVFKKIVKDIEIKQTEDTICILPKSDKVAFYPLCKKNQEGISFYLINQEPFLSMWEKQELSSNEQTYNTTTFYNLNHHKFCIWNYKGFDCISEEEQKTISLFSNDVYNIPLSIQIDQYIVMADYNEKYEFNQFYVMNTKKNQIKKLSLEKIASFDAYFLGQYKHKVYFMDKKNKKEIELVPKKLTTKEISTSTKGSILQNGKWETSTLISLANKNQTFTYDTTTHYELENETLYKVQGQYKTKITEQSVKEIIKQEEDVVYYLVKDQLYSYDEFNGEVLLLKNNEWNFNYQNMIYIF